MKTMRCQNLGVFEIEHTAYIIHFHRKSSWYRCLVSFHSDCSLSPPLCFPSIQIGLCPLPSSLHLHCSLVIPVTPTPWTVVSLQPSPYPKLWPRIAYLFFQAGAGIQDSTCLRLSYSLLSIRDGFHCLALLPPFFSLLHMNVCLMFGDLHLLISPYSHFPIPALLWAFASSLTILSHQHHPQSVPFFFLTFLPGMFLQYLR